MSETRWAVLGTANIAAKAFLPALRAAGGRAVVVGSRDPDRARAWADANQVDAVADYDGALDADVDAVYVALPNDQHTTWAKAAVATGRAVLCEKPLGVDLADTEALLAGVPERALLWEAFVFPFHPQTQVIRVAMAELGRVHQIVSEFHFTATGGAANIRWQAERAGGSVRDVGCYCLRLARLLFDGDPTSVAARASWQYGVDADCGAVVEFAGERRLLFSSSMRAAPSTYTRVIGDAGELRIDNPFHPVPGSRVRRFAAGQVQDEWHADERAAFQYGVEHIHAVLAGQAEPRHLAATDALGNARAIEQVLAAAG